ncbi:hypothetical protein BKA03_000238 [Demequina lutea]|uniref:Uncharacterized protein n=1 Tax=Demequina lutea TaxID=431489 RepID=A0A7Y9Z799_9MICO|nr:hypothetical protein [Demequina lutea]
MIYTNDLSYLQADSGGLRTWLTNQKSEYGGAR